MKELIQYFEALEARIAALEARVAELENRPTPEPQVIEKIVENPVVVPTAPVSAPQPVVTPQPVEEPKEDQSTTAPAVIEVIEEIEEAPVEQKPVAVVEEASPKAAIYGKPVDDIRLAISLGDRFLYQRELFGQNAELMQRTLSELNDLGSFDEAMTYINRFSWDRESPTYQQFIVTLHRRFG